MEYYAKISKRFAGALIDCFIFYSVLMAYIIFFGESDRYGSVSVHGFKALFMPLWWFTYYPIIEGISGQTLGKRVLKMRVVKINGGDIGFGDSFVRHLVDFVDMFFFGLVGFLVMNNSEKHQRVGDQLAKTIVVVDQEAVCIKCGEQLVLSHREFERGRFVCPKCKQENIVAQSIDKGFDSNVLDA